MKNSLRKSAITLAIISSFGLTGCFNSTSGPSEETTSLNKTTTGVITGFGSVFINGVEYETDQSAINVDGVVNAVGDDSGLKLGMVVTLSGDATGQNGNALSIEFNDEVEGMVTAIPVADGNGGFTGDLKVMGITIKTDDDTVFESNVALKDKVTDLQVDHIVEVSGYSAGDGTVWATRIELKKAAREANDKVEIKGLITNLVANTFMIGEMPISVSDAVLADEGITELVDGMLVEVKSNVDLDLNGVFVATEIELKSEDKKEVEHDADDDEVEVEGRITATAIDNVFDVNGSSVTFGANTRFVHGDATTIAIGLKVKVKGSVDVNGNFLAETILFKPTGDIKMTGPVISADETNNTVNMFGLTVKLVSNTFVEDDRDVADDLRVKYLFGANDLAAGDWLEIKAYKNSNGELVATKMIRKTKELDELAELKGKVDSLNPAIVSGINVDLSSTSLVPAVGDRVELEGTYDETTSTFNASQGEPADAEEHYIGGEDGEEHVEDEKHHDGSTSNSEPDSDDGLEGSSSDDSLVS